MAKAEGETQTGELTEKAGAGRQTGGQGAGRQVGRRAGGQVGRRAGGQGAGGQVGRRVELQLYTSSRRCAWNCQHNRCSVWEHLIIVFA